MNNRDLIDLCLRNLLRRRTRTLLAVVGVIVGTCAIVVMMSIGFGLTDSYQAQIESYGNLHMITVYSGGGGQVMAQSKDAKGVINDKAITDMSKMEGVEAVTPVISENLIIGAGKKIASVEIKGIRPEVLEKFNYKVLEGGRLLKPTDKYEILFGNQVPTWFQDPKSTSWSSEPFDVMSARKMILTGDDTYGQKKQQTSETTDGQKVVFKEYDVRATGVLENPDDDSAYCAYMNIETLEEISKEVKKVKRESSFTGGRKTYQQALVYVADINKSADISKQLRDLGFQTSSPSDWLESMKETAKMIQGILGGIGGISLLVAALGITNTMIMSIYERTKEIGVMKVIGANLRDIRKMFLLEAGLIGFLGGAAGLLLSEFVSLLMNTVLKDIIGMALGSFGGGGGAGAISRIPIWLGVAAVLFATAIGIAAGYYPAKRAMNLSALESLKNE